MGTLRGVPDSWRSTGSQSLRHVGSALTQEAEGGDTWHLEKSAEEGESTVRCPEQGADTPVGNGSNALEDG